jgi:hypothetical protein
MKNLSLISLLVTCMILVSCKKEKGEAVTNDENLISEVCYKAIYEQDTLDLKINALQDGTLTGSMEMIVFNKPKKIGGISGEFRGDTLFTSYTYYEEGNESKTYKNPMAFLKQGDQIILGNGETEYALGGSYFIEGKPIDFENVKYKFTTVDCV